ncbi:MAG: PorP/SprF family type IX secretion system membrane protein [Flavobacteriales bacterium]|nr:PorP/SprF family type IX secretion system membrane protein [Flavobacteriales bacterium]
MNIIRKILLLAVVLGSINVHGQIVSQNFYTYRLDNMFNANPAYSAEGEGVNFIINAMSQNQGVSFANKNFMGGVYSKISPSQGLGARIVSDTRGAFQVLKGDITYAYILKINEDSHLNFGINSGILNTNLVTSRIENYELLDQSDAQLYSPYFNSLQFTAGFGALYKLDKLEVSIALPNLVSTNDDIITYLNGALQYTFDAGEKFKVTPWLSYQNLPVIKSVGGLYVKGDYLDKLWLQAGYQTNSAFSAMAGFKWENFGIGYGYTFSNKLFSVISTGYHEVSLRYQLVNNKEDVAPSSGNTTLADILSEMTRLADTEVTEENKEDLKDQLVKLKKELLNAEIDNTDPKQAKKVEEQLTAINEKLIILEQKLK